MFGEPTWNAIAAISLAIIAVCVLVALVQDGPQF